MRILILTALVGIIGFSGCSSDKTGFVQNGLIYDGFLGKDELEQKYIGEQNAQKARLDSMQLRVEIAQRNLSNVSDSKKRASLENEVVYLQNMYAKVYEETSLQNERSQAQYTEQIWQQINSYIMEYGKENGFDYIHGANGSGTLMYAKENKDITEEVLEYINQKYQGQ